MGNRLQKELREARGVLQRKEKDMGNILQRHQKKGNRLQKEIRDAGKHTTKRKWEINYKKELREAGK